MQEKFNENIQTNYSQPLPVSVTWGIRTCTGTAFSLLLTTKVSSFYFSYRPILISYYD